MPHPKASFRRIVLMSAVMSALPATLVAQQEQPGPVLPPPSLYEAVPPKPHPAVLTTAPRPAETPRAASVPAAAPPAAAASEFRVQPSATAAAPARPAAVVQAAPPAPQKQPWYRSMFSWFRGGNRKPAANPAMQAPAPQAQASAGRSTPTAERSEYAYDSPSRTIRTGVFGECVKTGMWSGEDAVGDCDPGARMATPEPAPRVAAAPPMPAPSAQPAPVEVQPLTSSAIRDERPLEPEFAPDSMVAPEPVPELEPDLEPAIMETMVMSADALFPLSSYAIKADARENLDAFVAQLLEADYESIKITGHTDPTGPAALNARLSRQRAEAVKRYLVARGVEPDRIVTEGLGSSQPVVTDVNCSPLPRAKKIVCYQPDRRVEIEVTGVHVAGDSLDDEPLGAR